MIFVSNSHPFLRFSRRETFQTIQNVVRRESARPRSLSVVFVGSRYIRRINRRFLHHDTVTDVIAFPLDDGVGIDGEVYVNLDRARSQARTYTVSFGDEVRRLLIHGTLHLLGYSDATARGKARMKEREDFFLTHLSSKKGRS
jgi:probable rRNA maturation factor